jgi:DNA-binding GntR family transcriptional regulator
MPQTAEALPPVRAVTPSQQVAEGVIDSLDTGRLVPGQRLVEADLCLRYGVGRGPVREALQRLANEGVVEISRNKGARIREISIADAIRTLEVTELLSGLSARNAAGRIGRPGAAEAVREVLDGLTAAEAEEDDGPFVQARRRFYAALLRIGANQELLRIVPMVQVHVMRAQFNLNRTQRRLIADYRAIGEAVLAGDEAAAEQAARDHVRRVRASLEAIQTE